MPLWIPQHASRIVAAAQGGLVGPNVGAQLGELDTRLAAQLLESPGVLQDYAVAYDDFDNYQATSGQLGTLGWATNVNGTAANAGAPIPGFINPPDGAVGAMFITAGTTSSGRAATHLQVQLGQGSPEFIIEMRVLLDDLSDGTDTFVLRCGFGDKFNDSADYDSGFYFELDSNADTEWQCKTADGGTRTTEDSGITAAADTWYRLRITCDGGGNVTFSIDGTDVKTITTNLPDAGDYWGPLYKVVKSAGTTHRRCWFDYHYHKIAVAR